MTSHLNGQHGLSEYQQPGISLGQVTPILIDWTGPSVKGMMLIPRRERHEVSMPAHDASLCEAQMHARSDKERGDDAIIHVCEL